MNEYLDREDWRVQANADRLFGLAEQTGSLGMVTINCARLGYLFKGDTSGLLQRLEVKREVIQHHMGAGLYPYTKRYMCTLRNHFSTIGLNGMHEMLRTFSADEHGIGAQSAGVFPPAVSHADPGVLDLPVRGYLAQAHEFCPSCDEHCWPPRANRRFQPPRRFTMQASQPQRPRCEVWTQVLGYHRPVSAFNPGKQPEHKGRVHFTETAAVASRQ